MTGRLFALAIAISTGLLTVTDARAGRIVLMYQMEPAPHEAADGVTRDQIRQTLLELLERKGWAALPRTSGVIEADRSINGNKHRMTIAVVFDDENYVIRYVDSNNLNFSDKSCRDPDPPSSPFDFKPAAKRLRDRRGPCNTRIIHPTYNKSVQDLEYAALHAIRFLDPPAGESDTPARWPQSAEEEINKLQALHESKLLSAEELEIQLRLVAAAEPRAPKAQARETLGAAEAAGAAGDSGY